MDKTPQPEKAENVIRTKTPGSIDFCRMQLEEAMSVVFRYGITDQNLELYSIFTKNGKKWIDRKEQKKKANF